MRNDSHTAAPATSPAAPSREKIPAPTIAPTPMNAACLMVSRADGIGAPPASLAVTNAAPGQWRSPVGRDGLGLGHRAALTLVHRDAEQQRPAGEEERRPVDPEAVAGVARV